MQGSISLKQDTGNLKLTYFLKAGISSVLSQQNEPFFTKIARLEPTGRKRLT